MRDFCGIHCENLLSTIHHNGEYKDNMITRIQSWRVREKLEEIRCLSQQDGNMYSAFYGYHCILAQGVPGNECILILWNTQMAFLVLCIDRSLEGHLTCCTALMIGFYLTLMYATVFHCFQNHNIGNLLVLRMQV